jgi:hypothetical protein
MALLVEKTKLYDMIYKKYKIKIHQLMKCVDEMNLLEDADIVAYKAEIEGAAFESMMKMEQERHEKMKDFALPEALSAETIAEITENVKQLP